jgi:hypothetical protein
MQPKLKFSITSSSADEQNHPRLVARRTLPKMSFVLWEKVGQFSGFFRALLTSSSKKRLMIYPTFTHVVTIFIHCFPQSPNFCFFSTSLMGNMAKYFSH